MSRTRYAPRIWANIRARLVRKVPEKAVVAAETAVPLVAEVRKRGVAGMWSDLKTRVGDLKKNLVSNLVSYLLPMIIIAGITWILSLFNPASAFIRACKMIIEIIRFVITNAAGPGKSKNTKVPVKPEDAAADAEAKKAFAAELGKVHRKARPAILSALRGMKALVESGNWAKAKKAMQDGDSTIKLMESKPLAPSADDAEAKKTAASVRRFGGGSIGLREAGTYLTDYKGEVHKPRAPFNTPPAPVDLFREAIWHSAQMPAALTRLEETMLDRVKMGGAPEPQLPLPGEVRREVLRKLRRATLRVTTEGSGIDAVVRIQLTSEKAAEITGYLEREAAKTGVDPKLKDTLEWWAEHVLQPEWHHAWPQWLGGAENHTEIYLPRVMHNFDGITTEQGKFPVGFHQNLNAKIKATFGDAFSINDAQKWDQYPSGQPGSRRENGQADHRVL